MNNNAFKDKCIVCGKQFINQGESPENVFVCSKQCTAEFQRHPEVIKELYAEQFLKRGKE